MNKLILRDKAILEYLTNKYGRKLVQATIKEIKENKNKKAIE